MGVLIQDVVNGENIKGKRDMSKLDGLGKVLESASRSEDLEVIRHKILPYYKKLVKYYENDLLEIEQDYRSGVETYGYEDIHSIKYNLSYISDRWRAAFRVRWLIELINPNYTLYNRDEQICKQEKYC